MFQVKVVLLNTLTKKAMKYKELIECTKAEMGNEDKLRLALQDLLRGNFLVLREGGMLEFQTTLHKSYWMHRKIYKENNLSLWKTVKTNIISYRELHLIIY